MSTSSRQRDWWRKKHGFVFPAERVCVNCEKSFVPPNTHDRAKTCSKKCSGAMHYKNNRATYKAKAKAWAKSNPERYRAAAQRTRAKNPELYRRIKVVVQQRRSARLRMVESALTGEQWNQIIAIQGSRCYWCGGACTPHMDHIIPISKFGPHVQENVVASCRSCNSRKKDRLWPITQGALYAIRFPAPEAEVPQI